MTTERSELIKALELWLAEHPVLWHGPDGEVRPMVDDRGRPIALITLEIHEQLRNLRFNQAIGEAFEYSLRMLANRQPLESRARSEQV